MFIVAHGVTGCQRSPADLPAPETLAARPLADGFSDHQTEWGSIIASDHALAVTALGELRAAAAAFHTYFGVRIGPGCVRVLARGEDTPECEDTPDWRIDWAPPALEAGHGRVSNAELRRFIRFAEFDQAAATPLALHASAISADRRRCARDYGPVAGALRLRHEIMHVLFLRYIWPKTVEGLNYGSDGPDWLDEAAAIMGEPPGLTRSRRARFAAMLAEGRVIPLDGFLSMEHPAMAAVRSGDLPSGRPSGGRTLIAVRRLDPGDPVAVALLDFYAQARAFTDFMIEQTGNVRWLGSAADRERTGEDVFEGTAMAQVPRADVEARFIAWAGDQAWRRDESICR